MIYFWTNRHIISPSGGGGNEEFLNCENPKVRGKDITDYGLDKIHELINTPGMPDLYLADYIRFPSPFIDPFNNYEGMLTLMIVDYNTLYNRNNTGNKTDVGKEYRPHIALMPKNRMACSHRMNTTNTTNGGFNGSRMAKTVLPVYEEMIHKLLGDYMMEFLDLTTDNNTSATKVGTRRRLSLPTEAMILGDTRNSYTGIDGAFFSNQLALFRLCPFKFTSEQQCPNRIYWLQNIASSTQFSGYNDFGFCSPRPASENNYIKPIMFMC